ncbi:MAG: methyltransferase domain-containing protein [Rhodothermaceae bacterium]|nr:methyltransferase domain-containing protein [Rhodothermaceae bacterium]
MIPNLKNRDPSLRELMDDPECNLQLLENTYRQFGTINRLLAGWEKVYQRYILPHCKPGQRYTLLDLGSGGGDLAVYIADLSRKYGQDLQVYATDPDQRAYLYALKNHRGRDVLFLDDTLEKIALADMEFDFVISNHLMHHLQEDELRTIMETAAGICVRSVIFNDIRRSTVGYLLFSTAIRPFFRNSFIIPDGLTSIKRSFTKSELDRVVPRGWEVKKMFPYRLLTVHQKYDNDN